MHAFDDSIAFKRAGDRVFEGELDRAWWIYIAPNGGFLASLCLHALVQTVDDATRPPRTLTVHYPTRAAEGPISVETTIERAGRRFTFASARMLQDGRLVCSALAAFGSAADSLTFDDDPMPSLPPPEDIAEMEVPSEAMPEFGQQFDYRVAVGSPFAGSGPAEATVWMRLREPRPTDAVLMPTLADAAFPVIFTKLQGPAPIPTLDLTVHWRAEFPIDYDWLLTRFVTRRAAAGFIEEDGEIWSRDGTLLAQSRQLALLPI
ncbi:MAG: thioesterase family protein [Acidobacteria bacterium]|nr:thioesterase family protein [Acidobacteriota bacterium]